MILKSCPFCGGRPYLEDSHRSFVNGKSTKVAFIRCKECNARSQRIDISDYGCTSRSFQANQLVADAWNKRVYDSDIDKLYEVTQTRINSIGG